MPAIQRVSQTKDAIEIDLALPDMARAAGLGMKPVAVSPHKSGYARLRIPAKGKKPAQLVETLNSHLPPDLIDFEAVLDEQGRLTFTNRWQEEPKPAPKSPGTCLFFDGVESTDTTFWTSSSGSWAVISKLGRYWWRNDNTGRLATHYYGADGSTTYLTDLYVRSNFLFDAEPDGDKPLFSILASGDDYIRAYYNSDRHLCLLFNTSTDEGSVTLALDTVYRIEMHVWEMSGEGDPWGATLRLYSADNVLLETLEILNEQNPAWTAQFVAWGSTVLHGDGHQYLDDMYVSDDWPGPGQCGARNYATGVGDPDDWSASAGTKPACVDEYPANDDTDYVYGAGALVDQLFTHGAQGGYAGAESINAVIYWGRARAVTASALFRIMKSGATTVQSYGGIGLTYLWSYPLIRDLNPDTSAAWTEDAVDALQFGVRALGSPDNERRYTSGLIMVDYVPSAAAGQIKTIAGVPWASVKSVAGVAKASIKEISGVPAN